MSKIKVKQINSDGQPIGAVLTTNGNGATSWALPLLGEPDDGLLTDPRFPGAKPPAVGLTPTTRVATAIDSINEVLGLLLPNAPAPLSSSTLALATATTTARVASGFTTNGLTPAPAAGTSVTRTTASTINTTTVNDVGDGASGELTLWSNGSQVDSFTFNDTLTDNKSTGLLRVSDNKWGGPVQGGGAAPDGFFQTFDANGTGVTTALGLNQVQLRHSISGNTNTVAFVRDDLVANPVVSAVTVAEGTKVGIRTSGVEHYNASSTISVSANATNLAGQTYATGTILSLTGPGTAVNFDHGQGGLPNPLNVNTLSFNMTNQTFTVTGNQQGVAGKVTVTATNPNGSGNATHASNLLLLSGTGGIREPNITGPATTSRIYLTSGTGDTPSSLAFNAWDSTQDLSAAGFQHEAAIVGGVMRCDQTNYSTGYLPAGNPNYSTKDAAQYVTYRFTLAARSSINVAITGTYTGMWVALPGISTDPAQSPNALGGAWWDARTLYNGSGIPGRSGQNAGAASGAIASGSSGTTTITFGTASSSSSTANAIIVRLRLNAGQSISAISIT